jgi:multicomponent K+:H+ antiporter subunit A
VLAIGLLLQAMAHGQDWVQARGGSLDHRAWVGWGLLVATLTGLASLGPWRAVPHQHLRLPLAARRGRRAAGLGASAFDLGVYLVVAGATLVMLAIVDRPAGPREPLMLLLLALGIGVLAGCGTWLLLRARSFDAILA